MFPFKYILSESHSISVPHLGWGSEPHWCTKSPNKGAENDMLWSCVIFSPSQGPNLRRNINSGVISFTPDKDLVNQH